jgi:hypothetical protein
MADEEDRLESVFLSDGSTIRAHKKKFCTAPCPIHAPSSHHMLTWPLHWRDDRSIFERICPHGIGHPDPDTMTFIKRTQGDAGDDGVHGCDGCCHKKPEDN